MVRPVSAVVLAAGEGRRMRSSLPKPLHRICGRPMVAHVLDALADLPVEPIVVVVGRDGDRVAKAVEELAPRGRAVSFVEQRVQRGTGDAVSVGLTELPRSLDRGDGGDIVVLPTDTPLLRPTTLATLVRTHRQADAAATLLTARLPDPSGYGRVVRDPDGAPCRIVEEGDASDDERATDEVNTSIYCFRHELLAPALRRLSPVNAQGEYYLTDLVAVLYDAGHRVASVTVEDPGEVAGVNDRAQLAEAEAGLRSRTNAAWMRQGVTMVDPSSTYVDVSVRLEPDVTLFPGTTLTGDTLVSAGAEVGPECSLADTSVGAGAVVVRTEARLAEIGRGARVGPFAVLEAGSRVAPGVVTGPFFRGRSATDGLAEVEPGGS